MGSNVKRPKIEFERIVYNAARDGELYRLKVVLNGRPKEEISMLVSAETNGSTPLATACRNGRFDVAMYLLDKCYADVDQVSCVTFDGKTIEGAPPLWCAAAAGHSEIVKLLVGYKAAVNSTAENNSTPLHAASFGGHFYIAEYLIQQGGAAIEIANGHGHTCLMLAIKKGHSDIANYLLQCGADVNKKSIKGHTALFHCVQSGSLEILKMLLKHGAKFKSNFWSTTPLLSIALTGHVPILGYFIEEFKYTMLEKVNAVELLGATFVDKYEDMTSAIHCWRKAMQMRYGDAEFPLEKPCISSPVAAYGGATEVRTFLQLEGLVFDPDAIKMQALLVRERILGPYHHDTVTSINCRGTAYANQGNFNRCIQLWMYALDLQLIVFEPLSIITQSSLLAFFYLFAHMMSEAWPFARGFAIVLFRDILQVVQRALKGFETAIQLHQDLNDTSNFICTLIIILHLVGLMCRLQPSLNKDEDMKLKQAAYRLVHLNPRTKKGWTPLHLACSKSTSSLGHNPIVTFPSPELVELLLEVGASPNAQNLNNNTPLHIAAMNRPCPQAVFRSLLDHGAHLDLCNHERQTPLQLAQHTVSLDVCPLRYLSLQCLCAKVVLKYNIPYQGLVHKELEEFIDSH